MTAQSPPYLSFHHCNIVNMSFILDMKCLFGKRITADYNSPLYTSNHIKGWFKELRIVSTGKVP